MTTLVTTSADNGQDKRLLNASDRPEYERNLAAARSQIEDVTWQKACEEARADGQAMTMELVIEFALEPRLDS